MSPDLDENVDAEDIESAWEVKCSRDEAQFAALAQHVLTLPEDAPNRETLGELLQLCNELNKRARHAEFMNLIFTQKTKADERHPWLLAMLGLFVSIARKDERVRNHLVLTYDCPATETEADDSWVVTIRRKDGKTPLEIADERIKELEALVAKLEQELAVADRYEGLVE